MSRTSQALLMFIKRINLTVSHIKTLVQLFSLLRHQNCDKGWNKNQTVSKTKLSC